MVEGRGAEHVVGKGRQRAVVKWIGADVLVADRFTVTASLPPAFVADLIAETRRLRHMAMAPLDDVRKFAGNGSWASGVGPALRNYLQPLWAVIGEAARKEAANPESQDKEANSHKRKRWSRERIHTVRIATTLNWLLALLTGRGRKPVMERTIDWRVAFAPPSILVTADASPWGMGAVLSAPQGVVLGWLATELSDLDCRVLRLSGATAGRRRPSKASPSSSLSGPGRRCGSA